MEQIKYRKTLDVHKNGIQFMLRGFETADNMSRVIEISLMASGDAIDFPLEQVEAMMYVTTPSAAGPSINKCTIKDNTVVYNVLPIVEEGITTMQLKLIETSPEGARSVLASPKFSIEVTKSNVDDSNAQQSTTFTALEEAVAKAKATYDARLDHIDIDSECIFRVYYADGTVYETDEIRKNLMQMSTEIDLDSMIRDGIANFTIEEVDKALDDKITKFENEYNQLLSKAKYATYLIDDYEEPTFVKWDENTGFTPYTEGLTTSKEGFALVYGFFDSNHTIVAWTSEEGKPECFMHGIYEGYEGNVAGWKTYLSTDGGTIKDKLNLGNGKGTIHANDQGAFIEAKSDDNNKSKFELLNPLVQNFDISRAASLSITENGNKTQYNLFGEHNYDKIGGFGYLRSQILTYEGDGENVRTFTFDGQPKILICFGLCVSSGMSSVYFPAGSQQSTSVGTTKTKMNFVWESNQITISVSNFYSTPELGWNEKGESYDLCILL